MQILQNTTHFIFPDAFVEGVAFGVEGVLTIFTNYCPMGAIWIIICFTLPCPHTQIGPIGGLLIIR